MFNIINAIIIAILTAFNVTVTYLSLKVNRQNFQVVKANFESQNKPSVIAYFDCLDRFNMLNFIIKNNSDNPALNVCLDFKVIGYLSDRLKDNLINSNFSKDISFLAPGQTISTWVGEMWNIKDQNNNYPKIICNINYTDINGHNYSHEFLLDINMFTGILTLGEHQNMNDLVNEVKKINQTIKDKNKKALF